MRRLRLDSLQIVARDVVHDHSRRSLRVSTENLDVVELNLIYHEPLSQDLVHALVPGI
jgi:hypothetical protein